MLTSFEVPVYCQKLQVDTAAYRLFINIEQAALKASC